MRLPGGLLIEGRLAREFELATPSGALDLRLHECTTAARGRHPDWVAELLGELLASLGGQPPGRAQIDALCPADRQAIVLAWRVRREPAPQWWHLRCRHCEALFDIAVSLAELPFSPAGTDYPFAEADTRLGRVRLRVPDGHDLAWLADQDDPERARAGLARRLLVEVPPEWSPDETDIAAIEDAVEACLPELAESLVCHCPECDSENRLELDPYAGLLPSLSALLDDVHRLASGYHWSEAEILALPEARRRAYLDRLDRARGLVGSEGAAS
ncbi:hypothetical protein [Halomonas sp. C05BenzN]|uniref:hypothetical protein n=1 Tax=Halomonas sp. C05BenzN TaxID=3411041 RepID=UPI003B94251D